MFEETMCGLGSILVPTYRYPKRVRVFFGGRTMDLFLQPPAPQPHSSFILLLHLFGTIIMTTKTTQHVAIIGLGIMGKAMTKHFSEQGFHVEWYVHQNAYSRVPY